MSYTFTMLSTIYAFTKGLVISEVSIRSFLEYIIGFKVSYFLIYCWVINQIPNYGGKKSILFNTKHLLYTDHHNIFLIINFK